ncbi:MAG: response regulator [Deltaproteobacteria bacterium]|nr:response regulator [Deltaproteobacteria bacterium]
MKPKLFNLFADRTMGFKLVIVFLTVILIPMILMGYISYKVIDSRLIKHAKDEVSTGIKVAWTDYYTRGDQMRYGMLQASAMEEIKNAVDRRDAKYLRKMMTAWKQMRPYVDIWAIIDENGKVIARTNSDAAGDIFDLNGLTESAISSRESKISTEILSNDLLEHEGSWLKERGLISGQSKSSKDSELAHEDIMALVVVTPVFQNQNVRGAIITADIINHDSYIPDSVSHKIPGLFTTISANGMRISTNLIDNNGVSLKGSRLPEDVIAGIKSGSQVLSEWDAKGMDYISLVEPIKNHKGHIIGALDAGITKEVLWVLQQENQRIIFFITLIGLSISLAAALLSTFQITRPLRLLKAKLGDYASGNIRARIEIDAHKDSKDEIVLLTHAFNSMVEEVSRRDEEKGRYLKEIEKKNQDFFELNEELKTTNEELEIAYEETQSQTEELHAINEELKLLNEDLDRKNIELYKANLKIKQEEEEHRNARNKLRLIYDSIRDYILLVDYDHRVLEANRHFMEKFKVTESLVAGKNIYKFFEIELPSNNCPIQRSIRTKMPAQFEINTSTGQVLTWHSFPFLDEKGETTSAVLYIRDITEQRLFAHKLIQTDKLSSLGELVSGVAHELNNPLTGIMCFSELLLEENLTVGVKTKLSKINDASHRCKKIIDNLLTFARWKRPEKKYEDINKVVRESIELRAYQLRMDNIEVQLELDESVPKTMLDENQVQQVFLNLVNNARDAILEKGEGGKIKVTSLRKGDKLIIRFEDTGKGMTDDIANKIFDPFFTTKGVGKGTGLGLSISYGIINEHGGNIYATSSLGRGTTFIVELPVIENTQLFGEDSPITLVRSERLKASGNGLKALILDDESIVLELLFETMTHAGFRVDKASSGEEALEKLMLSNYDLIISDIKMPGLDGKGFYREAKRIRPEILNKIIFISGDSINRQTQEFLKESGNFTLKKPFTVDQLNDVISKLLYQ